jgi:hypothetical protein
MLLIALLLMIETSTRAKVQEGVAVYGVYNSLTWKFAGILM